MRIAVAGGTGVVGTHVVRIVEDRGHRVVVLTRGHGVDLLTGDGLDTALVAVDAVIDVSNVSTLSRKKSVDFFTTATTNLLAAEQHAGVRHHVVLSIVGIDRVQSGYYEGKRRQEDLVKAGTVPSSILRATQFHEFAGQVLALVPRGPVVVVPRMKTQPVAAREVASALVALALGPPTGVTVELAGPEVMWLADMVSAEMRARREHRWLRRPVLHTRLPMAGALAMASGGLLPSAEGPRGVQTFAEWVS